MKALSFLFSCDRRMTPRNAVRKRSFFSKCGKVQKRVCLVLRAKSVALHHSPDCRPSVKVNLELPNLHQKNHHVRLASSGKCKYFMQQTKNNKNAGQINKFARLIKLLALFCVDNCQYNAYDSCGFYDDLQRNPFLSSESHCKVEIDELLLYSSSINNLCN